MIQMLPLISKKLKIQESKSIQQQRLEEDYNTLRTALKNLKDANTKKKLNDLMYSVASQIEHLDENPNHYE